MQLCTIVLLTWVQSQADNSPRGNMTFASQVCITLWSLHFCIWAFFSSVTYIIYFLAKLHQWGLTIDSCVDIPWVQLKHSDEAAMLENKVKARQHNQYVIVWYIFLCDLVWGHVMYIYISRYVCIYIYMQTYAELRIGYYGNCLAVWNDAQCSSNAEVWDITTINQLRHMHVWAFQGNSDFVCRYHTRTVASNQKELPSFTWSFRICANQNC